MISSSLFSDCKSTKHKVSIHDIPSNSKSESGGSSRVGRNYLSPVTGVLMSLHYLIATCPITPCPCPHERNILFVLSISRASVVRTHRCQVTRIFGLLFAGALGSLKIFVCRTGFYINSTRDNPLMFQKKSSKVIGGYDSHCWRATTHSGYVFLLT